MQFFLRLYLIFFLPISLYSQTITVNTNADGGSGNLRQAIIDINNGSDSSNTINLEIFNNSPIVLQSDLPVIKKNMIINSTGKQPIDGQGKYRLFATIMADLTLNNCSLQNGAAIGGEGGGGGGGFGGGVYIDRGNTLILTNSAVTSCKAEGGPGGQIRDAALGGGGASFSTADKNGTDARGGGDFPGTLISGGVADGSPFLTGYGGGEGGRASGISSGGGDGVGQNAESTSRGGDGGYCGGGGGKSAGGGGNGGGNGINKGGGGGFGSGGFFDGGGGFGGGGAASASDLYEQHGGGGGGGFGGGGGGGYGSGSVLRAHGGRFGGNASSGFKNGGGGAGLGGAIFVGDTATCIIEDNVSISNNQVIGGSKGVGNNNQPGQGYAPDIFLFRKAKVIFNNQQPLSAPYSIMGDQEAPAGHLDSGVVKQGPGQLTLSNTNNNYRGGTSIEGGTLSVTDPKALGSQTSNITLNGGTLQPTKTMTINNPIVASGTGGIDTPAGTTLTTTGNISGNGTINKTNNGTWRQTGTSTHSGDININQGTLQVDGTLPSNVNVKSGGTLQGTGTAGGNVTNSGTVKPSSDQLGTLTIGGNYTQNPDGLLQLQMRPSNQSDHFNIKGTVQIDGALDLQLQPGIYQKDQRYNLIHADGGLNGFFNQISSNSRFSGQIQITPNDFNLTFVQPQIILPIQGSDLPRNQKNLSDYLFCDSFPFENNYLVDLLQVLFQLPVPAYQRALASMTPEIYGALSITEKNNIQYLMSLKLQSCIPAYHYCIVTPLFYTDHYRRMSSHLPNYTQNTGGINLTYQTNYPTNMAGEISATYVNTHLEWGDQKGRCVTNSFYLAPSLLCNTKELEYKMTVLGGYNLRHVNRRIAFPSPLHTQADAKSWNVAESILFAYNHLYHKKVIISPSLTLLQTNIFERKIRETKPKGLNLETEPKTHSFLDTILSLGFKLKRQRVNYCAIPSIVFGWHKSLQLTDSMYSAKLDNYTACAPNFMTKSYCGDRDRFFIDASLNLAHVYNWGINHRAMVEFGSGDIILAVSLSFDWAF